jgi:hypothetical protein
VAARQLALLDGGEIGRVVAVAVVGFGLGLRLGGRVISEVKLSVGLYPDDFAVLRPALGEMVRVLLVEIVDRSHVVVHKEMILKAIHLKFLEGLIEGESIEDTLVD